MSRTYLVLFAWGIGASSALAQAPVTTVWFGAPATLSAPDPRAAPLDDAPLDDASLPSAPSADSGSEEGDTAGPTTNEGPTCPGAVHLVRHMGGPEEELRAPLLDCRGRPIEQARRRLAILMRPRQDRRTPTAEDLAAWERADGNPDFMTAWVHLPHPALMARVQRLSDSLSGARLEILSGYRPHHPQSRHAYGRALDLRTDDPDALHAAAVGLPGSGVGWHEQGRFIHLDVRPEAAYWEADEAARPAPVAPRAEQPVAPAPEPTPETASAASPEEDAAEASSADVNAALSEIQRAMHVIVPPPP